MSVLFVPPQHVILHNKIELHNAIYTCLITILFRKRFVKYSSYKLP